MNSRILEFRHSGTCACGRLGVRSTSAGQGVQHKHSCFPAFSFSCFLSFRQSPARRPFRRGLAGPRYAPIALADLTTKLNALDAAGAAYLFIDTAPSVGAANAELFAAADLVLIPLNPTPADLRALVKGLPLIKQSGRPFSFVLTRVRNNLRNNDATSHPRRPRASGSCGRPPASSMPGSRGGFRATELRGPQPSRPWRCRSIRAWRIRATATSSSASAR
jgi:hypothetical protein